jgi:hypothetical protein
MDSGSFLHIVPLGNMAPPAHVFPTTHMYFLLPSEEAARGEGPFGDGRIFPRQPVYAAADGYIVSVGSSAVESEAATESYIEYDLHIEVCDGMRIRYGHIGPLSERLLGLLNETGSEACFSYETGGVTYNRCNYRLRIPVAAGEQIGFTSGRAAAFDFGASRPGSESQPDTFICPLDLYAEAVRAPLNDLLGDANMRRTAEPRCGTVDYDVPGTAQGNWRHEDPSHTTEDWNIALAYDNIRPEVPVLSIGVSVRGIAAGAYRFMPAASDNVNRPFTSVTPGAGAFCYEALADRWGQSVTGIVVLIELADESTLLVEARNAERCGAGPFKVPENATRFVR